MEHQLQLEYQYDLSLPESRDFIINLPPLVRMVSEPKGPIIRTPEDIYSIFGLDIRQYQQEMLMLVYADVRNRMTGNEILFIGTMDSASLDMKVIFRKILLAGAYSFFMIHNHPSGDATASPEDVQATRNVIDAATMLDLVLHDHVIIAKDEFYSIRRGYPSLFAPKEAK